MFMAPETPSSQSCAKPSLDLYSLSCVLKATPLLDMITLHSFAEVVLHFGRCEYAVHSACLVVCRAHMGTKCSHSNPLN